MFRKNDIKKRLSTIFEETGYDINDHVSIMEMDSLSYIGILIAIEETFNIEFPDTVLIKNMFYDIEGLCELIGFLLGEQYEGEFSQKQGDVEFESFLTAVFEEADKGK